MDPMLGLNAEETLVATQALWYGRLCTSAATAVIFYDHLITLGDEVRLIWHSRWSAGKVLFLLSRYYNVFQVIFNTFVLYSSNLTARMCFAWLRWQAISGLFVYGITEIILMLRLYAMYSSSKRILAILVSGFTAVVIAEIVIIVLSTKAQIGPVNADPHSIITMAECVLTDTWPLSYTYWIPFLAFETILFVLASAKGIMSLREQELHFANFCGTHVMKAFEVLIRDSILYFMLIFAVYLTNVLAWTIDGGRIGEIPVGLAVAVSTVMAQRLLLNIRANFAQRAAGGAVGVDSTSGTASGDRLLLGGGGGIGGGGYGSDGFTLSAMEFEGVFDALGSAGTVGGVGMGTTMGTVVEEGVDVKEWRKDEKEGRCAETSPMSGWKGKQSMDGEKRGFGFEDHIHHDIGKEGGKLNDDFDIEAQHGLCRSFGVFEDASDDLNSISMINVNTKGVFSMGAGTTTAGMVAGGRRERGMSDLSGSTAVYSPTTTAHTRSPTATGTGDSAADHWQSGSGGSGGFGGGFGGGVVASGSGSRRGDHEEGVRMDETRNFENGDDSEEDEGSGTRRVEDHFDTELEPESTSESVYASAVSSPTSTFAMIASPIPISPDTDTDHDHDHDPTRSSHFFPYVVSASIAADVDPTSTTSPEFPFSIPTSTITPTPNSNSNSDADSTTESIDTPFRTPLAEPPVSEQDVGRPVSFTFGSDPPSST